MYHVKMAFALIQVGTNLWVNPMQVQGIAAPVVSRDTCQTVVLIVNVDGARCSDWPMERVKQALAPAAVAKALEGK